MSAFRAVRLGGLLLAAAMLLPVAFKNWKIFVEYSPLFRERVKDPKVVWSWEHNSNCMGGPDGAKAPATAGKRLLIAQASGTGLYKEMMDVTSEVNALYARRHGIDFVKAHGVLLGAQTWHATFNKVALLEAALDAEEYDAVLILDADAVIVDFDVDFFTLMPDGMMFTAERVEDESVKWNVNAGVMIWNLRHPEVGKFAKEWMKRSAKSVKKRILYEDDQGIMQDILQEYSLADRAKYFNNIDKGLINGHGKHIVHKMRAKNSFDKKNLKASVGSRTGSLKELCEKVKEKIKVVEGQGNATSLRS